MSVYLLNVRDSWLHFDGLLSINEGSFLPFHPCISALLSPMTARAVALAALIVQQSEKTLTLSLCYANFFLASYSSSQSSQHVNAKSPLFMELRS